MVNHPRLEQWLQGGVGNYQAADGKALIHEQAYYVWEATSNSGLPEQGLVEKNN